MALNFLKFNLGEGQKSTPKKKNPLELSKKIDKALEGSFGSIIWDDHQDCFFASAQSTVKPFQKDILERTVEVIIETWSAQYGDKVKHAKSFLTEYVQTKGKIDTTALRAAFDTMHAQAMLHAQAMERPFGLSAIDSDLTITQKLAHVAKKTKGVEPGWVGQKRFTLRDVQKLNRLDHPFSYLAAQYVIDGLKPGQENPNVLTSIQAAISQTIDPLMQIDDLNRIVASFQEALQHYLNGKGQADAESYFPESENLEIFKALKKEYLLTDIQTYIVANHPKFQKRHYVKLDYDEADAIRSIRTGKIQKVRISEGMAKSRLHRYYTAKTRSEANWGAIRETLANDLMRAMGIYTQDLKILKTQYTDGTPKLLLDGKHMVGPNGEGFEDFSGKIVDGYLVDADGNSDQSIQDLGKYLIYFLLMADRDAIGSRGDNKGRVGNMFAAIDPGHSLEVCEDTQFKTNLMGFKNVHEDFSFDQPEKIGDKLTKGYKNFTIFQDRPYLEKFKGVIELRSLRSSGKDIELIDQYWAVFSQEGLNFQKELEAVKAAYIARRDYILDEVFGPRLEVYDSDPVAGPNALALVHLLEQATSVTDTHSPHQQVRLSFPRTVKRMPWVVQYDATAQKYTFFKKDYTAAKVTFSQAILASLNDEQLSRVCPQVVDQLEHFSFDADYLV